MGLEKVDPIPNRPELASVTPLALSFLQKFVLYRTRSNYYMIGRDKSRTIWRLLKIDRLENSELNIFEDTTTYSENELNDMLKQIDKENKSTGGLITVTTCYGIVGFFKFMGPQYMLLITERRAIGVICGHKIYSIAKTKMFTISNATVQSNMPYSKNENRSFVYSVCDCKMSLVLLRRPRKIQPMPELFYCCKIVETYRNSNLIINEISLFFGDNIFYSTFSFK